MKPFLPPKAAPIMHGFLVSGLMSLIVTGIATLNAIGISDPMFTTKWGGSWIQSWNRPSKPLATQTKRYFYQVKLILDVY